MITTWYERRCSIPEVSRDTSGGVLGSKDIQELVLKKGEGELIIISEKGCYYLKVKGERYEEDEKDTVKISYNLSGTLIQW